jgi:hypothetical protein
MLILGGGITHYIYNPSIHEWDKYWVIQMYDDFVVHFLDTYGHEAGMRLEQNGRLHVEDLHVHEDLEVEYDVQIHGNIYTDGGISVGSSMDIHGGGLNVYGGDLNVDHDVHISGRLFVNGVEVVP